MHSGLAHVVLLASVNTWTIRAIDRKAIGWTLETEEQIAEALKKGHKGHCKNRRTPAARVLRPENRRAGADEGSVASALAVWHVKTSQQLVAAGHQIVKPRHRFAMQGSGGRCSNVQKEAQRKHQKIERELILSEPCGTWPQLTLWE